MRPAAATMSLPMLVVSQGSLRLVCVRRRTGRAWGNGGPACVSDANQPHGNELAFPFGHATPPKGAQGCQDGSYHHPNIGLFPDFAGNNTAWFDWVHSKGLRTYFNDHPFSGPFNATGMLAEVHSWNASAKADKTCGGLVDASGHCSCNVKCFNGSDGCPVRPAEPTACGRYRQTDPREVSFRWEGLTSWLTRGLDYWWYDANWQSQGLAPFAPEDDDGCVLMPKETWGSYYYYTTQQKFLEQHPRKPVASSSNATPGISGSSRALAVSLFDVNVRLGDIQHVHAAKHRYPVHWTGDAVVLQTYLETTLQHGVYDFAPYVYSDGWGGGTFDNASSTQAGKLLRWLQLCTLTAICKLQGPPLWNFVGVPGTTDFVRSYLLMRYKLMPSFIAGGHQTSLSGFPIAARCDLTWPAIPEAASSHQYLLLNDTLVAPIWDLGSNVSRRSVWIPPGQWSYAWNGSTVDGGNTGRMATVAEPYQTAPMWHRHGGLVFTTLEPAGSTVDTQDWSTLALEAFFPSISTPSHTHRNLYDREVDVDLRQQAGAGRTAVTMTCDGRGGVRVRISEPPSTRAARSWLLRLHLEQGHSVSQVVVDGLALLTQSWTTLLPSGKSSNDSAAAFATPFVSRAPPQFAGPVVEVSIAGGTESDSVGERVIDVTVVVGGSADPLVHR